MPQQEMFTDESPSIGLALTLKQNHYDLVDSTGIEVVTLHFDGSRKTRALSVLREREQDYVDTYVSTMVNAWRFGPTRELAREAAALMKLARRHRRSGG